MTSERSKKLCAQKRKNYCAITCWNTKKTGKQMGAKIPGSVDIKRLYAAVSFQG